MFEKIKEDIDDLKLRRVHKKIIAGIIILIIIFFFVPFLINKISIMKENEQEIINNSEIIQYPNKTAYIPVKKITENRVIEVTQDTYKNGIFHMINGEKFSFKNFAYAYGKIRTYNIARNKRPYDIFMGPNLDPTDGEIEGYIFHDFLPNDTILTYIYVDQDWKENIENTHIIWGESANWDNYTHKKKFNFQKIADGIYRDVFVDDRDRFSDDYMTGHGGVKVGNESLWLGN